MKATMADVSIDPTGKWMVFASTRHNEHPGIYIQRTEGTAVTKLTSDDSDNAYPLLQPGWKTDCLSVPPVPAPGTFT